MGKIGQPCCQEEPRICSRWVVGCGPPRSRRSAHAVLLASLSVHQWCRCGVHRPAGRACCARAGACVSWGASAVGGTRTLPSWFRYRHLIWQNNPRGRVTAEVRTTCCHTLDESKWSGRKWSRTNRPRPMSPKRLGDQVMDDSTMDVGQTEVSSRIAVRELLVIKAH